MSSESERREYEGGYDDDWPPNQEPARQEMLAESKLSRQAKQASERRFSQLPASAEDQAQRPMPMDVFERAGEEAKTQFLRADDYHLSVSEPKPISSALFEAHGPGLTSAYVGKTAHFYIVNKRPDLDTAGICRLLHTFPEYCGPKYHFGAQWIVWIYGPSMATAKVVDDIDHEGRVQGYFVSYRLDDPGEYELHLVYAHITQKPWYKPLMVRSIRHSPHKLTVMPSPKPLQKQHKTWATMPVCKHTAHSGRWVRCRDVRLTVNCPVGGWVWLPHACRYQMYNVRNLPYVSKPKWIVIAGTSIIRGTFLMMLDRLLGQRVPEIPGETLKCWGWIDLRIGNFRVSYLDMRVHNMFPDTKNKDLQYTVPVRDNYAKEAQQRLANLGKEQSPPDVFYLQVNADYGFHVPEIRSWLGNKWQGKFIVSVRKPGMIVDGQKMRTEQDKLEVHAKLRPEWKGIRVIDEVEMAAAFVHRMEKPMHLEMTHHHHYNCSMYPSVFSPHELGRICSPAVEMSVQLLLNEAFDANPLPLVRTPRGKDLREVELDGLSMEPRLCQDCDVKRMFASINPRPQPVCVV